MVETFSFDTIVAAKLFYLAMPVFIVNSEEYDKFSQYATRPQKYLFCLQKTFKCLCGQRKLKNVPFDAKFEVSGSDN